VTDIVGSTPPFVPFSCDCGWPFPEVLVTFDSDYGHQDVMVTVICPSCSAVWDYLSRSVKPQ
jgi:hypothetical protein